MGHTSLAVIIPTHNAEMHLEALVGRLRSQEQFIDEILVIDSASEDRTVELAQRLKTRVIVIDPGTFDHGKTRNLAASKTKSDILIFMTQDAMPVNNETVSCLVKHLQIRDNVVSYARQIPAEEATISEKFLRRANYPPDTTVKSADDIPRLGIKAFQNSNVCAAYRRKEFEALGRFPEPVVCNEDMLFAAKVIFAGYKVVYCAEALVYHTHCLGLRQLFRRYFDIAASLDQDKRIKALGKAEEKGFEFFMKQLVYLRDQKKLNQITWILLETASKYLGYKAGGQQKHIPKSIKKYLGENTLYWSSIINNKANKGG